MQELLTTLHQRLSPQGANLLLNALKNSQREAFFNFVLENLEHIITWLNSSEFAQNYAHLAYPPLLNPNFVDTDSSRHCAQLAWDLNLPLPKHYKFIYISPHGSGAAAFLRFLNQCCGVFCAASWVLPFDSNERYIFHFMHLSAGGGGFKNLALNLSELNVKDFDKFLALLDQNANIIYALRDPISLLKHCVGRDWSKVARNFVPEFDLSFDFRAYLEFLRHKKPELHINFNELRNSSFLAHALLPHFNLAKIHFMDMSELDFDKAEETMKNLALKFDFAQPDESKRALFKMKEFKGYIRYLFPLKLFVNEKDIKQVFSLKKPNNTKNSTINKENSLVLLFSQLFDHENMINIMNEFYEGELNKHMGIYTTQAEFERLKASKELFKATKAYLGEFCKALQEVVDETEQNLLKEEELLDFLKHNESQRKEFKKLLDEDLKLIKKACPHILASWKYYASFEKLCKDLDS
ncbi:invasion protein [Campylobacter sp. MIT 12-8780]|uniref:DUF2972 domain-containing protein n=1 Tax=Campylobacter sp. MIT 12-8780 TaxID=2202200 RepID=UPI00115E3055|nr:DUF2972 domain-containing protein [Campylobacter sp. MIT 12-8780]TQR40969.1 invasion protein [Campylobacter sp. MIT 12-8780]